MPDLVVKDASAAQLKAFGDAALRLGQPQMAINLYRAAIGLTTGPVLTLRARIGLAQEFTKHTAANLDLLQQVEKLSDNSAFAGAGLATWLKHPPFARDRRFMELVEQHAKLLPAANWHWNLSVAAWAAQQTRPLAGDFVELGVFKGHTTRFVADYVGFGDWEKTWFLYDTFEGIPQDQLDPGWEEANARAYSDYSFEEVRDRFADLSNVRVIQGRVPEVLEGTAPEAISFLHVDLNNATAEVAALEALFDRITPGGVILFDDFGWATSHRQQAAELAWLTARGQPVMTLPTGQGLVVKGPGGRLAAL